MPSGAVASLGRKVGAVTVTMFFELHQAFLRDWTVLLVGVNKRGSQMRDKTALSKYQIRII
jgi:hypothetical protein